MTLRGKISKKQKEAFKNGNLWVKRGPLRYSRLNEPIEDLVGKLSSRVNASAADILKQKRTKTEKLKSLFCPFCQHERPTKNLKLHSKSQTSNLLCETCCRVSYANKWSCKCGLRWQKCDVHEIQVCEVHQPRLKRKRHEDPRGCDEPMPKLRRQKHHACTPRVDASLAPEPIRVALPPGSKLASRFPHHVKRVATDLRVAPG